MVHLRGTGNVNRQHRPRRPFHDEHEGGYVAIVVAMVMVTSLSLLALVVDISNGRQQRLQAQAAADASAIAAAEEIATVGANWTGSGVQWADVVVMVKGYALKVVMPENVSIERRQLLEVFGAEVISSPGDEGSNGAIRKAQALAAEHPEYVFLYQYANEANPAAHYRGTGPEIWRDCPEVDVFVAGLGTTGTLMGVGRYLKERKPSVQVVAVEPPSGEIVQGLRGPRRKPV